MEITFSDCLASIAIVISVIVFIQQVRSTKKSNEIQFETYRLSKKIDDFENRKGEVLLLNIIGRFFIVQLNFLQINGKVNSESDKKNICQS